MAQFPPIPVVDLGKLLPITITYRHLVQVRLRRQRERLVIYTDDRGILILRLVQLTGTGGELLVTLQREGAKGSLGLIR